MPSTDGVSRRHALALLGSGVLAGCLTQTDSEPTDTPTTQNPGEETPQSSDCVSTTPTETATPTAQPAPGPTFDSGDAAWAPPTPPANGTWPLSRYGAGGTRAAPQGNGPSSSSFPLDRRWEQSSYVVDPNEYETVYNNMPPHGLAASEDAEIVPASDHRNTAAGRMGQTDGTDSPLQMADAP